MMTQNQSKTRIEELRSLLQTYSHSYHVLDEPVITDAVYDSLFSELKKLESEFPDLVIGRAHV